MSDCGDGHGSIPSACGGIEFREDADQKTYHEITSALVDTLELRALCAAENPDQWLRDAIRHRAVTSNVDEVLPISDEQLRESLTD